jgi:type I restriction enzyme S subunit
MEIIETVFGQAIPKGIDREWMSFVLQEYTLLRYVESFSKRAAGQDGVNPIILKKYPLPLPDLKEQVEVSDFLHSKTKEIENIIAKKEQLLAELESYKKSLIFEYVTGKKEVIS